MTTISITKPKALAALREAVAAKGADYVYPKPNNDCVYTYQGQPSCIVGHVLASVGVPLETIQEMDSAYDIQNTDIVSAYHHTLLPAGVKIGPKALEALVRAQNAQDTRYSWGEALRAAETV